MFSYKQAVTKHSLTNFIKVKSKTIHQKDLYQKPLIELNMESFYRIAKDEGKTAFVLFYAPWCEKCKRLLKIMKEVSTIFRVSYLKRVIEIGDFVALWYEVLKLKCDFIFTFDILSKLLVFWYCIGKQRRLYFLYWKPKLWPFFCISYRIDGT